MINTLLNMNTVSYLLAGTLINRYYIFIAALTNTNVIVKGCQRRCVWMDETIHQKCCACARQCVKTVQRSLQMRLQTIKPPESDGAKEVICLK